MTQTISPSFIVGFDEPILITGAAGFIGARVISSLLELGFRNLRCFVRPTGDIRKLAPFLARTDARVETVTGNLLSPADCEAAAKGVAVIIHLAAGRGEKSFPDAYMNSVVTTRNLLDAAVHSGGLKRFLNISSFAVYDTTETRMLDESCPMEARPERRGEAYCFAKVKQDELVAEYGAKHQLPFVILRPGYVFGPGKEAITGRVGIDTFGMFLHMGGGNRIPFTYVDNCADAIALAALRTGVDGQIFNVVDDDLPSSRQFLRLYKQQVKSFRSIYVPHAASYLLCRLWGWYARWSHEQLPPVFNWARWHANWKRVAYTNAKLKSRVGWVPKVPMQQAMHRYFEGCRKKEQHA